MLLSLWRFNFVPWGGMGGGLVISDGCVEGDEVQEAGESMVVDGDGHSSWCSCLIFQLQRVTGATISKARPTNNNDHQVFTAC